MRIETRISGTVFEARLCDRMTFADHARFRALLQDVAKAGVTGCVFDLSALVSIDTAGLGMLLIAAGQAGEGGWTLALRSPQRQVRSLLELGGFGKRLALGGS
jgi:HptB-dependent secretion and biofilm anti anti-sigma factor